MSHSRLLDSLTEILAQNAERAVKAARVAEAIRNEGPYRWVGLYRVESDRGIVSNIAWSGTGAPAYPEFPLTKGLTARAIFEKTTINVGDVANDPGYLPAFDSTRAEIIVPIFNNAGNRVIGTIDVESERVNAFDASAQKQLEECAHLLAGFWLSGE